MSYILTKVAVTVYAGGVVFKDVFNIEYITLFNQQIDFFWVSAIGLVCSPGLYTVFGGMKAVLYTSILQTPILLAGSIAILVIGLTQLGGWGNLMEIVRSTDATYLNDAGEVIYRSTTDSMGSLMRSAQRSQISMDRGDPGICHHWILVLVYRPVHRTAGAFRP